MHDAFHVALKRALTEKIEESANYVAGGLAKSFEDYKKRVGYIQAMKDVLEICEDIHKKLYENPLKGAA